MPNREETHLIEYQHDGAVWILRVSAASQAEAWQRINTAAQFGTYMGVQVAEVPVSARPIASLWCAVANAARRLWPRRCDVDSR